MDWLQVVLGGLVSSSTVVTVAGFISREWFTRLLDRRLTQFKHELQLDAKTR